MNKIQKKSVQRVAPYSRAGLASSSRKEAEILLKTVSIRRRIACAFYETLLLLGVFAFAFMLPHLLVGLFWQINAPGWLALTHLFSLFGVYFIWHWLRGGQTLAMQTWKIRLIGSDGQAISFRRALLRFVLTCLWLIPAILIDRVFGVSGAMHVLVFFLCALLFAPVSALFDKDKLFLYDRLARTRLVRID